MLNCDVVGRGPAILFVHGFPLDRWMWHPQVAGLEGYRRIAPDLPGLGESPPGPAPTSMATYAAALARHLDELHVESVVLCGLSMGGYVAMECLRQWPGRITGLVLMDTRADADSEEGRQGRDRLIAEVRARGAVAAAEVMMPRLVGAATAAARPAWLAELRQRMERTPAEGVVSALEAMKQRPDSLPTLARVTVPSLVMVGAEDAITPLPLAEAMAEAIPGAELSVIGAAGHLPTLEQPEQVNQVLRGFLERVV